MIKNIVIENLFSSILTVVFVFGLTLAQIVSAQAAFGDPDTTFGSFQSGKINDIFLQYAPEAIALQADGKILVVGFRSESGKLRMVLRRYNANGSVDFSFGNDGTAVTYNNSLGFGSARHILIQNDGKILVAGTVTLTYAGTNQTFLRGVVWRFNSNGFYDSGWGSSGRLLLVGTSVRSIAAYQPAGSSSQNIFALVTTVAPDDYYLYRLLPNGSSDTTFGGGDGIKNVSRDSSQVLVKGDGFYLLNTNFYAEEIKISKHIFNGLPYRGFGTQGVFTGNPLDAYGCNVEPHQSNVYLSFDIQSDGKIVAGGHNQVAPLEGSTKGLLARHQTNGGFDLSFNMKPCDGDLSPPGVEKIRIHTNDDIYFRSASGIFRRTPEGVPNGVFLPFVYPRDYLIQPDGKIVVVGTDGYDVQLSRYLP